MKRDSKNYTLKVLRNGKEIQRVRTHRKKRFVRILRMINWQHGNIKAYIKVSYGKKKDAYGKLSEFYNDGWYKTKEDLLKVFIYFDNEI